MESNIEKLEVVHKDLKRLKRLIEKLRPKVNELVLEAEMARKCTASGQHSGDDISQALGKMAESMRLSNNLFNLQMLALNLKTTAQLLTTATEEMEEQTMRETHGK